MTNFPIKMSGKFVVIDADGEPYCHGPADTPEAARQLETDFNSEEYEPQLMGHLVQMSQAALELFNDQGGSIEELMDLRIQTCPGVPENNVVGGLYTIPEYNEIMKMIGLPQNQVQIDGAIF